MEGFILVQREEGQKSACAPRAISVITGLDFNTVNHWLLSHGHRRGNRSGTTTGRFLKDLVPSCLEIGGNQYTFVPVGGFRGRRVVTAQKALPEGGYLIRIRGHIFAMQDGVVTDVAQCFSSKVKSIHKLTNVSLKNLEIMTLEQAKAKAKVLSKAGKKQYVLEQDGNGTVNTAPLPGWVACYLNGEEVKKGGAAAKAEKKEVVETVTTETATPEEVEVVKPIKKASVKKYKAVKKSASKKAAPKKVKAAKKSAPKKKEAKKSEATRVINSMPKIQELRKSEFGRPTPKNLDKLPQRDNGGKEQSFKWIMMMVRDKSRSLKEIRTMLEKAGYAANTVNRQMGTLKNSPYIKIKDETVSYIK